MTVSGGVMPTPLMISLTGVGSVLSARSIARISSTNSPSSGSGTDHGLEQPFHWSSGGTGSHGATTSGSSTRSTSMKRHWKFSSFGAVRLSVPLNSNAIVSMLSWDGLSGPSSNSVFGGSVSPGGGGPTNS